MAEKNNKEEPVKTDEKLDDGKFKEGYDSRRNLKGRGKGTRDFITDFEEAVKVIAKQTSKTKSEIRTTFLIVGLNEARSGNFNFWNAITERIYGKVSLPIDFTDETETTENKLVELLKNAEPKTRKKFIRLFSELHRGRNERGDLPDGPADDDKRADIPEKEKNGGVENRGSSSRVE